MPNIGPLELLLLLILAGAGIAIFIATRSDSRDELIHKSVVPGEAPAGWYQDPTGASPQRYWDGTRWTDHTN